MHYVSIVMRIFYIDTQQYWKCHWTMDIGANAHGKRTVSTKQPQVTVRLESWASNDIGKVSSKFLHHQTISQCDCFIVRPFLAATKQLYEWFSPSVRPFFCLSVCLSVTPFWLCYHHRIIMKFSGVITNDQGKVHAKRQGQRSKVKVTEVTTQLNRFRTVTPVWIHIWWWNDTYSLMLLRRGALLFFKVIHQISRSHGAKNRRIWPRLGVSGL